MLKSDAVKNGLTFFMTDGATVKRWVRAQVGLNFIKLLDFLQHTCGKRTFVSSFMELAPCMRPAGRKFYLRFGVAF